METNSAKPVIWAVSDGRAGNVAMAMGLAERVAEHTKAEVIQRDLHINSARAWLAARIPVLAQRNLNAHHPYPSLVIGAGRRVAPTVAALRGASGKTGAKLVQILEPQMSLSRFDRVIIPEHDNTTGANVLTTLGSLGRITRATLADARAQWFPQFAPHPRPLIAVLIGGSTKRTRMTDAMALTFAADLRALTDSGAGLAITASRRTPPAHTELIRQAVPTAYFWDGQGANPYLGMLACADALVVTDDSVNMASEAAATGKPLAIYPLLSEGGKIAHFHAALIQAGHAEWFDGIPTTCAARLDETGRIAQKVAELLCD